MNAKVSLTNTNDNYYEEVIVENIENRNCFTYVDKEKANCEMCIYDDGICFFKESKDHLLELHLKAHNYAKITTEEGSFKIDIKVIDFISNSDILIMRYLIDDEERVIKIEFN